MRIGDRLRWCSKIMALPLLGWMNRKNYSLNQSAHWILKVPIVLLPLPWEILGILLQVHGSSHIVTPCSLRLSTKGSSRLILYPTSSDRQPSFSLLDASLPIVSIFSSPEILRILPSLRWYILSAPKPFSYPSRITLWQGLKIRTRKDLSLIEIGIVSLSTDKD